MTYSRRNELRRMLREMDPDELVDMLEISSRELMAMFPDQVADYLERNAGDDEPTTMDEVEEWERDQDAQG